jgi:hypothetical protein
MFQGIDNQLVQLDRLPVVGRWEGGLGAPLLLKAEVLRPILRENSSNLVVCSCKQWFYFFRSFVRCRLLSGCVLSTYHSSLWTLESKSMLEFNKNFPVMVLFSACASGQQRSNSKHNVHTGHSICCTILHCHDFGS